MQQELEVLWLYGGREDVEGNYIEPRRPIEADGAEVSLTKC